MGQESFRSITKVFYRGAHAVLLCYSMGDLQSFENLKKWMDEIRTQCSPDVMIYLVGNKSDLPDKHKQVSSEKALRFKTDQELDYVCETSAKIGNHVN